MLLPTQFSSLKLSRRHSHVGHLVQQYSLGFQQRGVIVGPPPPPASPASSRSEAAKLGPGLTEALLESEGVSDKPK